MNNLIFKKVNAAIAFSIKNFGMKREGRSLERDALQEATRIAEIVDIVSGLADEAVEINLLEVGLGSSMVTSALRSVLSDQVLKISAIEHPDVDVLKNKSFLEHLEATKVTLKSGNVCETPWPFDSSVFDVVVFSETIEHLPPTIVPAVLAEIGRILKNGGVVIISTPNLAAWQYRWKLLRGKKIFDPALPLEWAGGTYAHIRLYTPQEVACLLNHFGMTMRRVKYMDFGLLNKPIYKRVIYKFVYALLPTCSPEFVMLAKKFDSSVK